MQKTIRSSARTKPDPLYYKKILDRLEPQRNALLDRACEIEEANDTLSDIANREATNREAAELRRQADKLTAKIRWAIFQLPIAQRMKQQLLEKKS